MFKNVSYTARDLFDRVWSTPVLQLAREIGVSNVALRKACRKAGISLPRRGHWAMPISKRPPAPTPPEFDESITFRVLDRSLLPTTPDTTSGTPKPPKPAKLSIPSKLTEPHPLVRKWLQAVKVAKDAEGRVELRREHVLHTRISRNAVDRAALLLDTLIKDSEKKGFKWAVDQNNRTTVVFEQETVYVTLRERVTKAAKPPPPPEPKSKRRPTREPVLWLGTREEYVYSSTGEFTLIAQEKPDAGSQTSWTDSKTGQLEDKLHLFSTGITKLIGRMRAYRAAMVERHRRWEEEDRIRRQAIMAAEHQRALQMRLIENMEQWEKAVRLRKFVDAVAAGAGDVSEEEGRQVEAWVEWARAQVASINPLGKHSTTALDNDEPRTSGHPSGKEDAAWWN